MSKLILSGLLAAALAACAGGGYDYGVNASVSAGVPDNMVEVSPGVYAMEGYDQPLFYANGNYWLYSNGGWYTSPYYTGGWSYVQRPPSVIIGIDHPYAWTRGRYNAYNRGYYYNGRYYNGRYYNGRYYNGRRYYHRNHVRVVRPPHPIND